ncbi:NAD-dependent epimerase/dehydratase family protein [Paenibacillus tritici]|jgi:GDP-4-dehydro-6-deoxy-D-mannose reductase|uniref:NAD-dependent epimerase/dehydratase family protein n=1 Tax=Paenibacillus tritici TaxID=1873425 RepID=A0ABX2DQP1_9BACL|nr:NAD-dependent epimerase/dehydratase family protein [Paenibacillus tritici]NQX45771.1 NAD-dependent epimerase/dehydratase family protein [Paenibacillus tritici]QUL53986.1 NAD-dependent epimerase/dehydratase family protein [Paenibacillus tritici]
MKGRRLLITGAAGFTGRHAVAYFAAGGAEVTAVVRSKTAESGIFPAGVRRYVCDLGDRKAVAAMIEAVKPDLVLHLAGKNSVPESWRDPLLYMETNVMATLYLLEALRFQPASRILVAGSRLKYRPGTEEPPHPYSLSKTLEELVSLAWGTLFKQPVLMAEPSNLIGPGPSTGFCSLLARHIVRSEEAASAGEAPPAAFRLSSRHTLRDFLDVRDAVRAYGFILDSGETGKVYRIDSGAQRELGDIAAKLLAHAAAPVMMDWGPDQEQHSRGKDSPASAVPVKPPFESAGKEVPPVEPEDYAAIPGWKPEIGLDRSLADIIGYTRAGEEGRLL